MEFSRKESSTEALNWILSTMVHSSIFLSMLDKKRCSYSVCRYFCRLLRGLSGTIISINFASIRGFKIGRRNLAQSERPESMFNFFK